MDIAVWLESVLDVAARGAVALPPVVAAAGAALLGVAAGFALWFRGQSAPEPGLGGLDLGDGAVILFRGRTALAANEAARRFLAGLPGNLRREEAAPALMRWLATRAPGQEAPFAAALDRGTAFSATVDAGGGRHLELSGAPRGALLALGLRDVSLARRAQIEAETALARSEAENRALRAMADASPSPLWRRRPEGGAVLWANAAYGREAGLRPGALSLPPFLFAGRSGEPAAVPLPPFRAELPDRDGGRRWFDVTEAEGAGGEIVGTAIGADQVVKVEAALRRFVETLTETFAHLPIGLAVFDRNRRLGLFNPAISTILRLDPAWLASRPGLREFLERLRENRQMPDQRDFLAWRRKLVALERDAEAANYEENWVLPSGQTLRVIGRPHPHGAIAFLFEDISAHVMLEGRYRSEIDMLRAVLHRFPEAVAIFRPDGTLSNVNTAFRSLWGFDPRAEEPAPHVARLIERWASLALPTDAWRRLRDFATGEESRSAWSERIVLPPERILRLRAAPLPDGSTFVAFAAETGAEAAGATPSDVRTPGGTGPARLTAAGA